MVVSVFLCPTRLCRCRQRSVGARHLAVMRDVPLEVALPTLESMGAIPVLGLVLEAVPAKVTPHAVASRGPQGAPSSPRRARRSAPRGPSSPRPTKASSTASAPSPVCRPASAWRSATTSRRRAPPTPRSSRSGTGSSDRSCPEPAMCRAAPKCSPSPAPRKTSAWPWEPSSRRKWSTKSGTALGSPCGVSTRPAHTPPSGPRQLPRGAARRRQW